MKINWNHQTTTAVRDDVQPARLDVVVPFTTLKLTRAALRYVATLGGELDVNVQLVDAQVVPFPVPVNAPTVSREFLEERLQAVAEETMLPTSAKLVFTRDRTEAFRRFLKPGSLVVIAASGWWFSAERKLARLLSKAGHDVVLLADHKGEKASAQRFSRPTADLVR